MMDSSGEHQAQPIMEISQIPCRGEKVLLCEVSCAQPNTRATKRLQQAVGESMTGYDRVALTSLTAQKL